ncbi:uncharacterized protein LOC106662183 isoform X2 [Cimex lectularius]|uniref:Nuclear respiratory factor 1 NLS/DNA-binding dimerisation domain-containing protein n=1 Tax=Cimex lectularius TaxID=79782 RepID=A0A8I6RCR4_CIMLE|nr:uncharacterized protein LOC106662183 isoform X2 [Cimex lectularius]
MEFDKREMVTDLPLIIANGTIKSLKTLSETELESFLAYLVKFTAEKDGVHDYQKPSWWTEQLPFPPGFTKGSPLPYVRNKAVIMRRLVKNCYFSRGLLDLLTFSEELSKLHSLQLQYLRDKKSDTITVFKDCSPVAIIPSMNLDYDYRQNPLVQTPCKPEVIKRLEESTEVLVISDEEDLNSVVVNDSDEDCVITGVKILKKENLCKKKKPLLHTSPTSPFKFLSLQARNKHKQSIDQDECIVISDSEDDKFVSSSQDTKSESSINEQELLDKALTQDSFLDMFELRRGAAAKICIEKPPVITWKYRVTSSFLGRIPSLMLIPSLVSCGSLSRKCLATPYSIARSFEHIRKNTNASACDYNQMVKNCLVVLERLDHATLSKWARRQNASKRPCLRSKTKTAKKEC